MLFISNLTIYYYCDIKDCEINIEKYIREYIQNNINTSSPQMRF